MDHQIGLVVRTVTTGSAGTRWFDVETRPSNEDAVFAVKRLTRVRVFFQARKKAGMDARRTEVPAKPGGR